jgi:hypothetical protein
MAELLVHRRQCACECNWNQMAVRNLSNDFAVLVQYLIITHVFNDGGKPPAIVDKR